MTDETERRPSEFSTPPGGLKVLPNGEIVYEFEGIIVATGLRLKEGVAPEPEEERSIEWLENNTVREVLYGYKDEGFHHLLVAARASVLAATGFNMQADPTAKNNILNVFAGLAFKQLLTGDEKSSWLQLLEPLKRTINFGESSVVWSATEEKTASELKVIEHGLGVKPSLILLTPGASEAATVLVGLRYIEGSVNETQFKVRGYAPVAVSKSTAVKFYWCAIG